jgi:enediyne biosynthesis protein E4
MSRVGTALLLAISAISLVALAGSGRPSTAAPDDEAITFTEITRAAGINFQHFTGAFGKKYLPETMGAGVCVLDYDNSGRQSLLFVNGKPWRGRTGGPPSSLTLYRNLGGARFKDVTAEAGLSRPLYGMGCAIGDYDDDGFVDIYVTALGGNVLFRNNGNGTFTDVTAKAGVADAGWSTSAAWVDYDKDGRLDLFVGHYVKWNPQTDIWCTLDGKHKAYCTPEPYTGESNRLFRNNGDGTFTDVSQKAGIANSRGKTLGVAIYPDEAGWPNLVVANDTQPNYLYVNKRNGSFVDEGLQAGIAFDENGKARGAMGVDVADFQNRGKLAIAIGNFSQEMTSFYVQEQPGFFFDWSGPSGVGPAGLLFVKFGLFFFDYNLDGLEDLLIVNGHVEDEIEKVQPQVTHAQRSLLFRNLGNGFREVGLDSGAALARKIVGRGAAYLDLDGQGVPSVVITTNGGPAYLLRNDGGNRNHRIRLTLLRGPRAGDGIGARVVLQTKAGKQVKWVKSGSSYLSQSELPLTFGLGRETGPASAEILWPSGKRESLSGLQPDSAVTIREGRGIVAQSKLKP